MLSSFQVSLAYGQIYDGEQLEVCNLQKVCQLVIMDDDGFINSTQIFHNFDNNLDTYDRSTVQ